MSWVDQDIRHPESGKAADFAAIGNRNMGVVYSVEPVPLMTYKTEDPDSCLTGVVAGYDTVNNFGSSPGGGSERTPCGPGARGSAWLEEDGGWSRDAGQCRIGGRIP